jgi:hypothetical protein
MAAKPSVLIASQPWALVLIYPIRRVGRVVGISLPRPAD